MKLAVVVQRYGLAISGGAELHARYVAERLAAHAEVEALTTCARDYVTWRNEPGPAHERINGVSVRRFPVAHERDLLAFSRHSARVFDESHSWADELAWLEAEGPSSPALIAFIAAHRESYDFFLFFSYRYYQAYHGARAVPARALLVPTAERDPAIGLALFPPVFRGVRGLLYNSPEERAMIEAASGNDRVPSVVVGVGSDVPPDADPARFRHKYGIDGRFALYVGRIDVNKGCAELFAFFGRYLEEGYGSLSLVLVGQSLLPVPGHPRIRHLGFLPDRDKFDAIAAADVLVVPSYFESLSMVTLEAWALGRPVLANGSCDVLHGQCVRSHAGLWYRGCEEFLAALRAIERSRRFGAALGANGRKYFQEHYTWPVIERKYVDLFDRLRHEPPGPTMEPPPGWLLRRRRRLRPAREVMAGLPTGPAPQRAAAPREARA